MAGKKALVLNHNLRERGTYFRAWKVAERLARRGWRVTFVTTSEAWYRPRRGSRSGITVWEMPNWSPLHHPDEGWGPLNLLWRMFVTIGSKWDLVYTFSHRPVDQIPARIARRFWKSFWICDWCDLYGGEGINAMAAKNRGSARTLRHRLRDRADSIDNRLERAASTDCDLLTVISSFLANGARSNGMPTHRIHKMISGADLEKIPSLDMAKCRRLWKLPEHGVLLGYIANYHPDEELLLDALEIVFAQHPDVEIIVAGHDFYGGREALERRNLQSRIRHVGRVPFDRIATFLGAADILLVPMTDTPFNRSRWPNKIGDYLAAGRAQVACAVGEVEPFMQSHRVGIGCVPEKRAFAAAITELIVDEQTRLKMSAEARRVAETEFDWDAIVDNLLAHIGSLRQ